MRNFTEERRKQIMNDELSKTVDRVFGGGGDPVLAAYLKNHYRQLPIMDVLFRAAEKAAREGSKSPYTKRIKKNANRSNLPMR